MSKFEATISKLDAATDGLSPEDSASFRAYLIGSLAASDIPPAVWDSAIGIAVECVRKQIR